MNPNQDLIDLINLNKLRDANDNCLLSEDEKTANAIAIERAQRERMNRLKLSLDPQQVEQKNEEWENYCLANEEISES